MSSFLAIVPQALAPPPKLSVSEWADENRVLDVRTSAEPGAWRTDRAPYLRGIMDAFGDPDVERVTIMSAAQVGKTECLFNMLAYAVDGDPGSSLYVMPTEQAARNISKERLGPMFELSPALARHLTGWASDETVLKYHLDRMTVFLAWANSPTALASFPLRYVFLDEVDKFPAFSATEADPVKLAETRTRTFWNRKIVECSTPTTEAGYIWRSYQASDQRTFHVPCPPCGQYQRLVFPQVNWPEDERDPDRILEGRLAWYCCRHCEARIMDSQKPWMLRRGVWCPEGCTLNLEGETEGDVPATRHRGYHLSALYSPWVSYSEAAAEFLRSKDRPELLMNFVNSWLGEPWAEKTEEMKEHELARLVRPYPAGTVPEGGLVLTAGVDVQKEYLVYEVRAWGVDEQSWLVEAGYAADLDEIEAAVVSAQFPAARGDTLGVRLTCMDSGYRTSEVYKFAGRFKHCVYACKGSNVPLATPYRATMITKDSRGRSQKRGTRLWYLDTWYFKDKVQFLRTGEAPRWFLHEGVSADYMKQSTAEHKVMERNRTTGATREVWQKKPGGRDNHYFDTNVLNTAAADILRVAQLRPEGKDRTGYSEAKEGGAWQIGR